jgi:hypothetical protein
LDVRVNVIVPDVIVGVYVEVKLVGLENVPLAADQDPEVADPPTVPARLTEPPAQMVWSILAFAVATGLTATVVDAVAVHPPSVVVSVYVPAAAAVAGNDGFCTAEVNPLGPVQAYVAPAGPVPFN